MKKPIICIVVVVVVVVVLSLVVPKSCYTNDIVTELPAAELIAETIEDCVETPETPEAPEAPETSDVVTSDVQDEEQQDSVKEPELITFIKENAGQLSLHVRKKPKAPKRVGYKCDYDYYDPDPNSTCDDNYAYPLYGNVRTVNSDSDFSYLYFNRRGDIVKESCICGDSSDPDALVYRYNSRGILTGIDYWDSRPELGEAFTSIYAPCMKVLKFDSQGRSIVEASYSGGICWNQLSTLSRVKYDNRSNVVEKVIYAANDSNFDGNYELGDLGSRYTWKYDHRGNKIESTVYNGNGEIDSRYTWKYDHRGNLIESTEYNGNGEIDSRCEVKYDLNGNKVEVVKSNSTGFISQQLFYYTANGILILSEYNCKDNSQLYYRVYPYTLYKYDNRGNMIEKQHYDKHGELEGKEFYKYDYMGNVIEFSTDSEYSYSCKYQITYYK